jgi:chromosome segregation ATPase
MRTIALVAAALAVAYTTSCKDRDRGDASADADTRVESTSEQATAEVREGAAKTEDAADDAADKTEKAAKDAGDKVDDAADDAGNAVEKAADETGISSYSYERRDAFRKDVNERLAAMDKELADLGHAVNKDATEAYTKSVAAARDTRKAVGRNVDRLTGATAANWDEVQSAVRTSLDSLDRQLRALRPDANPMGGAGPS